MPLPLRYGLSRLGVWVGAVTGLPVLQADQGTYRRDLPYVGISRLPGGWSGRPEGSLRLLVPTAWTLGFAGVLDTEPAAVEISGETIEVGGVAGAAARTAWITAFTDSYMGADGQLSVATSGASSAILTTGAGWGPPVVRARQQITVTPLTIEPAVEIWRHQQVTRWRVQVYGSPAPESVLGAVRREWERSPPPGLQRLSAPVVLSLPSGADREVRGYLDADLALYDTYRAPGTALASVRSSPGDLGPQ